MILRIVVNKFKQGQVCIHISLTLFQPMELSIKQCTIKSGWSIVYIEVFCFDSLRPINNLSVIKGRVFLRCTSTKLGSMFLLKDTTQ